MKGMIEHCHQNGEAWSFFNILGETTMLVTALYMLCTNPSVSSTQLVDIYVDGG